LFIGLKKKGWQIDVLTVKDSPLKPYFEAEGIRVLEGHPTSKFDKQSKHIISNLIATQQYDLVHTFNAKASAVVNQISFGAPTPFIHVGYRGAEGPFWFDITEYLALFHPDMNAIMCSSLYVMDSIKKNNLFRKKKLFLVYKGIKIEFYDKIETISRKQLGIKDDVFLIIGIANIRSGKGVQYLIEAFHGLETAAPCKLLLVGKDSDSPPIRSYVSNGKRKKDIICLGYEKNVLPILKSANLYVQPSLSEGLSKSVIEAMALGVPVISTRCGGPEELLVHGESGILVEKKSSSALTSAIEAMIIDPEKSKQYASKARQFLIEHLTNQNAVSQLEQAYLRLLESKSHQVTKTLP